MGHPEPIASKAGSRYRFEKGASFFTWAILAIAGGVSLAFPPGAFLLLPLAFLFTELNPYRFLVLWIAATLFFCETYRATLLSFSVADSLPLVYGFLLVLFALPKGLRFRVPMNAAFIPLYLLIVLAFARAPGSFLEYPTLSVAFDVKTMALMALIPVLIAVEGARRRPKMLFLLLGAVILFSSLHALELLLRFALLGEGRPTSWAGIFLVSSIVFCLLGLQLPLRTRTLWLLRGAALLCAVAIVVMQTRGLWISALFCVGVVFLERVLRMGRKMFGFVLRILLLGAIGLIAANLAFYVLTSQTLAAFIQSRLMDLEWIGLLDPYSSTGYRLHESWAVWEERTFWGHGPGATIHLFFTQLNKSQFMDWWSIHSGYFELLHKYGFVGLFLFAWMGVALFLMAQRLKRRGKKWETVAGSAVQLMLLNHAIYSISANEFNRPNSPIMWFLAFYITFTLAPRRRPSTPASP